jgi:hypothetical protein
MSVWKTGKRRVIFMTIVSAILFCILTIYASLSSLAYSGPKANTFGSAGMWTAVGTILAFYLIPLFFYVIGIDKMKLVIAIFIACGLFMSLTTLALAIIIGLSKNFLLALLSIASLAATITWFVCAFQSEKKSSIPHTD